MWICLFRTMFSNLRTLVALFWVLTLFEVALSQGVSEITIWRDTPVAVESINARLREWAEENQRHGQTARMGMSEKGYPESAAEFNLLDGNALLMVTGVVHRPEMLPIKRVFAEFDREQIDLVPIKAVYSKNSNPQDLLAKMFGQYRVDALYLMPVYLRTKRGTISVAFSNDEGAALTIAGFDGPLADKLPNTKPTGEGPSKKALEAFIAKKFPAFVEKQAN